MSVGPDEIKRPRRRAGYRRPRARRCSQPTAGLQWPLHPPCTLPPQPILLELQSAGVLRTKSATEDRQTETVPLRSQFCIRMAPAEYRRPWSAQRHNPSHVSFKRTATSLACSRRSDSLACQLTAADVDGNEIKQAGCHFYDWRRRS